METNFFIYGVNNPMASSIWDSVLWLSWFATNRSPRFTFCICSVTWVVLIRYLNA